jgi:hypothetical protein
VKVLLQLVISLSKNVLLLVVEVPSSVMVNVVGRAMVGGGGNIWREREGE